MNGAWNLDRFVGAQDDRGTYERALSEIRAGRKVSHWMWFVFPQLAGLGQSSTAKFYGISGLDEARAYVAHAILGHRLAETTTAVLALDDDPDAVFGPIDALKLRSCMTLFSEAAPDEPPFSAVIHKFYDGVPDPETLMLLP